ncbi:MAG: hypothetical protein K2N70_08800 [Helicobacter sp.]|nr:hypothetical protein [Helicobacter sp.]
MKDFENCYKVGAIESRQESERFRAFSIAEIQKRDKTNLDIFWLKDESLEGVENLPRPEILANEICSHLESALREMRRLGVD